MILAMRRLRMAVLALAASCGGTAGNNPSSGPRLRLTAKDIVQRSSPAIVRIEAGPEKVGTGFIVDKAGVVATNLHVVVGESAIKIKLSDGSQYAVTQIDGLDPARDLALLQIRAGKDLPTLQLGDSSAMSAGDQVVAIGNPLGFDNSVTSGLISQVRPVCGQDRIAAHECKQELTVLQISAAISPGSTPSATWRCCGSSRPRSCRSSSSATATRCRPATRSSRSATRSACSITRCRRG